MSDPSKDTRLGELLKSLGIISRTQLTEAVRLAGEVVMPLGRALVLYGYVSQDLLNIALEFQILMKNRGLPIEAARRAYGYMQTEKLNIGDALTKAGWTGKTTSPTASRLGTLLLDAGVVTEEQLEIAQRASYETGQPIGRMLVLMNVVNQQLLDHTLAVQKNYRDDRISYSQALKEINPNPASRPPVETDLPLRGQSKTIRLGELLMLSGVLTESDIMNALEVALTKHKPFGTILIDLGLLSQSVLDLSLKLQELVCNGSLTIHSATDTLYSFAVTGNPDFVQSRKPNGGNQIRLGELLKMSGFIHDEDIEQAIALSARYPSVIGKMLVVAGAIDEATLLAALRCQFLLRHNIVSVDMAVKALQLSQRNHISLDDALDDLGVKIQAGKS